MLKFFSYWVNLAGYMHWAFPILNLKRWNRNCTQNPALTSVTKSDASYLVSKEEKLSHTSMNCLSQRKAGKGRYWREELSSKNCKPTVSRLTPMLTLTDLSA